MPASGKLLFIDKYSPSSKILKIALLEKKKNQIYLEANMYLKEVEICPNCGEKSKILKRQPYGDGMVKYSFNCPKCKLFYASSWKEKKEETMEAKG